ncbi:MAG: four helix bundle suffix domain-containing protein [Victivallales bacterium]|nr:four helix bundle suffix domain-containing protein [Victivallales bacterium]
MTKPQIILPHGGYQNLLAYQKSEIIYQGTVVFCNRFLNAAKDRTVDQMVQAARSCKQNIVEGSEASATSKETEIKLTNVARASLGELLADYCDYTVSHRLELWTANSPQNRQIRDIARSLTSWEQWREHFLQNDAKTLCNTQVTLIHQAQYLLERLLASQEASFRQNGGIRERMNAVRNETRGNGWEPAVFSYLQNANSATELENRIAQIQQKVFRDCKTIKRQKGWE